MVSAMTPSHGNEAAFSMNKVKTPIFTWNRCLVPREEKATKHGISPALIISHHGLFIFSYLTKMSSVSAVLLKLYLKFIPMNKIAQWDFANEAIKAWGEKGLTLLIRFIVKYIRYRCQTTVCSPAALCETIGMILHNVAHSHY